jgi:hypothetical protein
LAARLLALAGEMRGAQQHLSEIQEMAQSRQSLLAAEFRLRQAAIECEIEALSAADRAAATRLQSISATLESRLSKLRQQQRRAGHRHPAVIGAHPAEPFSQPFSQPSGSAEGEADGETRGDWRRLRAKAATTAIAWCARVYRRAFGSLPRTTPYHPYHTMLQPVLRALERPASAAHILVISSGGELAADIARALDGEKLAVTPGLIDAEFCERSFSSRPKFDLCFCDLGFDDLAKFRNILDQLRPFLALKSRVVIAHHNLSGRARDQALDQWTYEFTSGLFPLVGRSEIALAGSYPGALSVRWFTRALRRHNVGVPAGLLALAATLALCAPMARLGWWLEQRREVQRLPSRCTNMTIVIDLP